MKTRQTKLKSFYGIKPPSASVLLKDGIFTAAETRDGRLVIIDQSQQNENGAIKVHYLQVATCKDFKALAKWGGRPPNDFMRRLAHRMGIERFRSRNNKWMPTDEYWKEDEF
ncbi:MAG: hypothetical protein C5B60_09160 [Chloroflexi bacterium]|nr:MAG: hypothetical protein C5B60_09160 [Chloroflexota bacterium]